MCGTDTLTLQLIDWMGQVDSSVKSLKKVFAKQKKRTFNDTFIKYIGESDEGFKLKFTRKLQQLGQ